MEEKIFVAFGYGRFQNNSGNMQEYCNVLVPEPFKGPEGSDYHFGGQKSTVAHLLRSGRASSRIQRYAQGSAASGDSPA
ncbi:MAG: hypothetical protein VB023_08980 [Oscillibacter sp.]|nr:hypothetical protein [Oscillibacter sp.]